MQPSLKTSASADTTVLHGSRDTVGPHRITRDAIMFDTLRQPGVSTRRVQYHIDGLGEIAQTTDVIVRNPLLVTPLAPSKESQPVRIDNPSGEAASLLVRRAGDKAGSVKLDFATNEAGQTFIFKATPTAFELVEQNQLGDDVYATSTICGSRIYMRVAKQADGKRQEWLYCLGSK